LVQDSHRDEIMLCREERSEHSAYFN
jgi:hypothetical protein